MPFNLPRPMPLNFLLIVIYIQSQNVYTTTYLIFGDTSFSKFHLGQTILEVKTHFKLKSLSRVIALLENPIVSKFLMV